MPDSFLDSNILIYFASGDPAKADRAEALMHAGGTVSVQVLNEIASVGRRKMGLSWNELNEVLGVIRSVLHVVPLTGEIHELGLSLARRHDFAIYDAMIVAAALAAECGTLWSEDMHDGMVVDNRLTIRNPFAGSP